MTEHFWTCIDELLQTSQLVIDRPKGSSHPRYPSMVYPLDYGYLEGTSGGDAGGIDVCRGSVPEDLVDALVCTVDLVKRDTEVKLLLGCTTAEKVMVRRFFNKSEYMGAILVERYCALPLQGSGTDDREHP